MNQHFSSTNTTDLTGPGNSNPAAPSVAVVILNWNGRKYLETFLPLLQRSTYSNFRIIIADNASTDDSIEFLKTNYPSIEILINASNEGFAKGYNSALKKIEAKYYVLLNSDVEVCPNWMEPIVELMESDANIAACQPKILSFNNRHEFEYAGACGGWLDGLGYPFSRGRIFDVVEQDTQQYEDAVPCFWASGAAMFVRSNIFHQLGGLDEYFFAHQEEIDFCWRVQLSGYSVYVNPASVVYHIGGGTLPRENNLKVFLNFRNNLIMLAKNLPLLVACWKLPVRMGLDGIAAWKGMLSGNLGYFIAIFRAHLFFFKWLLIDRPRTQKILNKHNRLQGWYSGSAVWQHFVKKKTKFSEIVSAK